MDPGAQAAEPPAGKGLLRWLVLVLTLMLGAVIGAVAVALAASGTIYDYQDSAAVDSVSRSPVDVIVVLAGARGRIESGADIWYAYRSRLLAEQEAGLNKGR